MRLSVIIPVYNTEKYLNKCINSILCQTEKDFEIILIDDGSSDSSLEICSDYASQYGFIRCIHIENSGPATAKNKGYEWAQGEYVAFIDSDDEILPEMYSLLLETAKQNNADVVCCSYLQVDESGSRSHDEHTGKNYILNREEGLKHLLEKNMIYSQCWTKIYKKNLLDNYNIHFKDGLKTEEDFIYNLEVFIQSKVVVIVDRPLYIYTHRSSSLSREYHVYNIKKFLSNMTFRLSLTEMKVKENFSALTKSCTIHCLQYYNLMIGRAVLFSYEDCQPYYLQAFKYLNSHKFLLLKNCRKCGLSLLGTFLFFMLSPKLYFRYRKTKVN